MRNKKKYDQDYHKRNLIRIPFNLNKEKDADIISYLEKTDEPPFSFPG